MESFWKRVPVRVNPIYTNTEEKRLKISSQWKFKLDPDDKGIIERWYEDPGVFWEDINVPGSWQGQGFGHNETTTAMDYRLQVRAFRAAYKGTGWYANRFEIQEDWKGKRIWVNFGGVHPSCEVWLNGVKIGSNNMPFVPFGFDVTSIVSFSRQNRIVVRVNEENRLFAYCYNWQGEWSGIYRDVEITATSKEYIDKCWIYPDVKEENIRFNIRIGDCSPDKNLSLKTVITSIKNNEPVKSVDVCVKNGLTEFGIEVPSPQKWSPDEPNLYRVDVQLKDDSGIVCDALSERMGFVELSTHGKHFLINGEPYFMRGTGDFATCPETGCPDTNRDRWRKKLKQLRAYGYNYVRCQSFVYCPEYFDIADEVGLLIQSEMGMIGALGGLDIWHVYQWPLPSPDNRKIMRDQWNYTVMRDVNHPSANIYCMSNEWMHSYDTGLQFSRIAWQCYNETKQIKPSAFVIWTDGGYSEEMPGDFVNGEEPCDKLCSKPFIQHEYRWWSSFPDIRIIDKYKGAVRPYDIEMAVETSVRHGIGHILPQAAISSQKLQFVEAKAKMELCREENTDGAGICHFNAMDINLSPQGIIDEFYEKKLVDAQTWLQTNGDTVILSSLRFKDRCLKAGDELTCSISVSDFSHPPFKSPVVEWELLCGNEVIGRGEISYTHKPFCTCPVGCVKTKMPEAPKAEHTILKVVLKEGNRCVENSWSLWVFPEIKEYKTSMAVYSDGFYTWVKDIKAKCVSKDELDINEVILTERVDNRLADFIMEGGKVILSATEGMLRIFGKIGIKNVEGRYFFTPPANYPIYEDGQNGTIIMKHPMLGDMPHDGFADFQFYRMLGESAAIDIEPLGLTGVDPVIRMIHGFQVGRPLACLLECSYGKGGMIICSLNLDQSLPEARYLLAQICKYAAGEEFNPELKLSREVLDNILYATDLP